MEAFNEIVKERSEKVYYFLRRMGLEHEDAHEIVQDAFILLWRDLKGGHGLNAVDFRLYQHALNKMLNFFNKSGNSALEDSSVQDKLVFALKQQEGFDFGDISEMLSLNISVVRNSFYTTLKN